MRFFAHRCLVSLACLLVLAFGRAGYSANDPVANRCSVKLPAWSFDRSAGYSIANAQMMLYAAYIAEFADRSEIEQQLQKWGLTDVAWIGQSGGGAYGYIAEADDYRIMVFRGTRSFEEGVKDALFAQSSYRWIGLPGRGHFGMRIHFKKLYGFSRPILESRPPKPLIIAGHSLGGAMAYIHAMKLVQEGWPVEAVYTSGQPRVGDEVLVAAGERLLGDRYYRLEHDLDVTTRVPPSREAANEFAALLPADKQDLREKLERFVNVLNYASPRGLKLALGEGIDVRLENDAQDEIAYWTKAQGSLDDATSIKGVFKEIQSRFAQHPPDAYICSFLQQESAGLR
jgi:hypothetical protein